MNQTSLESSLVCLNSQNNCLALNRAAKGSFIKMWAFTDIGYAFCTFCARCGPEKHNLFSFSLSPDAFSQIFFSLLKWTELCGESRCTSLISVVRERYILGFLSRLYFLHKAWQQRKTLWETERSLKIWLLLSLLYTSVSLSIVPLSSPRCYLLLRLSLSQHK